MAVVLVQILPYHGPGAAKYERLGRKYELTAIEAPSEERMEKIKSFLETFGLQVKNSLSRVPAGYTPAMQLTCKVLTYQLRRQEKKRKRANRKKGTCGALFMIRRKENNPRLCRGGAAVRQGGE